MPNYRYYYVIDQDNNVTLDEHGISEFFTTERAAIIRARVAANENPGDTFAVVGSLKTVICPVGEPLETVTEGDEPDTSDEDAEAEAAE